MILIMDGRLQSHNLRQTGKNEAWLSGLLNACGVSAKAVYLASLDTRGSLLLQLMDGQVMRLQALQESEVIW
jgi:uncharacterized membrane protein YcaP (DUF421 family)